MSKKMGRPPKNMCVECRGWGEVYKQESLVTYFGDGDTKLTVSFEQPRAEACTACNGTGYTGGKLRQGTPPVMEQWAPDTPRQSPPTVATDDDTTTKGLVL